MVQVPCTQAPGDLKVRSEVRGTALRARHSKGSEPCWRVFFGHAEEDGGAVGGLEGGAKPAAGGVAVVGGKEDGVGGSGEGEVDCEASTKREEGENGEAEGMEKMRELHSW